LAELGNRLKEARLASGLSLDDLQSVTKIQKRYLVGIEQGDFSAMPGNFYVRAFIKQYAEAVQLDPDEIFETYKAEIPAAYNEHLTEQLSRVKTHKTITDRNPKVFDLLPKILIGVIIIGVAALIYYYLTHHAENKTKESERPNEQIHVSTADKLKNVSASEKDKNKKDNSKGNKSGTAENSTQPTVPTQEISVLQKSRTRTTYQLKNADKFVVKLASNGKTWVNIKNGKGYSFFQGILDKNGTNSQTIDLSKETTAVLVIGNANDTDIFVNDQKIDYAIPPSQAGTQTITIQFVPKNK
jgi:cytoskeletal protein RodZ